MNLDISDPVYGIYISAMAVSIIISVGLISYLWQRRYITAVVPVVGILMSIIFWSGGYLLEQAASTLRSKLFMYNIEYIGIVAIPIFFLMFALQYARKSNVLSIRRLLYLLIIPVITLILVWTKDFHTLMYRSFNIVDFGTVVYVTNEYGIWFWIFMAYVYLLILASTVILIRGFFSHERLRIKQAITIILIIIIPVITNLLYVFRLLPSMPYVDWTGAAFSISAIIMAYAIVKQRFLDVLPVARDTAIEIMSDGYLVLDEEYYILDINNTMCSILGVSAGEAIGSKVPAALSDQINLKEINSDRVEIGLDVEREHRYYRVNFSPLKKSGGNILIFYDITESKQLESKLADLATHDFLTGLPNRVILQDRLEVALARAKRSKNKFAVMVCDLDNFKAVNDTLGHGTADRLLKAVGNRLNSNMREEDTLARVGGDEFVILLAEVSSEEEAASVAKRILDSFKQEFIINGFEITVSISIGIAIYPDSSKNIGTLLKNADDAMYAVKNRARGNFHIYGNSN